MITAKVGMIDGQSTSDDVADQNAFTKVDIDQKWQLFQSYLAESLTDTDLKWSKKVDQKEFKDGFKASIHQRKQKGLPSDLMRIEVEMQNVYLEDVVDYYINPPPNELIKEKKDLETLDDGSLIKYMLISMPMMSERDNVIQISQKNIDGGVFLVVTTVEHPAMPPVKGVVRMFNHVTSFLKQDGKNVKMIDYEYVNMKGYLPAALLNMTMASEMGK